jgi:hypothetical protein
MTIFEATMIAEGQQDAVDEEEYAAAWQLLHDTGVAYQLQGWFGRTAQTLLDAGIIT